MKLFRIVDGRKRFVRDVPDDLAAHAIETLTRETGVPHVAEPRVVTKDWSAPPRLKRVRLRVDPRHTGQMTFADPVVCHVTWDDSGWKSVLCHGEVEDVPLEDQA